MLFNRSNPGKRLQTRMLLKSVKPSTHTSILKLTYQTLVVFLNCVLAKRYTNASLDIITVLAGLDQVDSLFSEFANNIEIIVRTGRTRMSDALLSSV